MNINEIFEKDWEEEEKIENNWNLKVGDIIIIKQCNYHMFSNNGTLSYDSTLSYDKKGIKCTISNIHWNNSFNTKEHSNAVHFHIDNDLIYKKIYENKNIENENNGKIKSIQSYETMWKSYNEKYKYK